MSLDFLDIVRAKRVLASAECCKKHSEMNQSDLHISKIMIVIIPILQYSPYYPNLGLSRILFVGLVVASPSWL